MDLGHRRPPSRSAAAVPIRPRPSTPTTAPRTSRVSGIFSPRAHAPLRTDRSAAVMPRSTSTTRNAARSATASVSTSGVFETTMPRRRASAHVDVVVADAEVHDRPQVGQGVHLPRAGPGTATDHGDRDARRVARGPPAAGRRTAPKSHSRTKGISPPSWTTRTAGAGCRWSPRHPCRAAVAACRSTSLSRDTHPRPEREERARMGLLIGFTTILVVIAAGAALAHVGVLDRRSQRTLGEIAFFVASPALMVVTISKVHLETAPPTWSPRPSPSGPASSRTSSSRGCAGASSPVRCSSARCRRPTSTRATSASPSRPTSSATSPSSCRPCSCRCCSCSRPR